MAKVKFIEVGRNKKSWEADVADPFDWGQMVRAIRAGKALGSREIDFDLESGSKTRGIVYVGGLRPVGRFEIVRAEA